MILTFKNLNFPHLTVIYEIQFKLTYFFVTETKIILNLETTGYDLKHSATRLRANTCSAVSKDNVFGGYKVRSFELPHWDERGIFCWVYVIHLGGVE